MKQRRHLLALLLILLFGVFLIKGLSGEDTWICENNHWIKHGDPISSIPLTGCGFSAPDSGETVLQDTGLSTKFSLYTDFVSGGFIPSVYTCQGKDKNPALYFTGYSSSVKTFALTLQDPDAPGGTRDHWVMWNINTGSQITFGELPTTAIIGKNSRGSRIYRGPCPPSGSHQYILTVYALDTGLDLPTTTRASLLHAAVKGHILDSIVLTGIYTNHKKN